jgi:pentatricopeptide repeat protein
MSDFGLGIINFENLRNLCKNGNLEELILLFFEMEKNNVDYYIVQEYYKIAFRWACEFGHLHFCEWIYEKFKITKKEVCDSNDYALYWSCQYEHYEIISFLFNTIGIVPEKKEHIISRFSTQKQIKIRKCINPFVSFTKPAKN